MASLSGPVVPAHLREDFTLLSAAHMRGQARLLFVGFIISVPIAMLGSSPGVGALFAYGPPLCILALAIKGLISLARSNDQLTDATEAQTIIDMICRLCLLTAALASSWFIANWVTAQPELRIYYPALMVIAALNLGHCLMAVRSAAIITLLVTLGPPAVVLAGTGNRIDLCLSLAMMAAVAFQASMMMRHQRLLLTLVEERERAAQLARTDPLTGLANRRELLERFIEFAEQPTTVRLMVVDIDRFKRINDRFGHDMGDRVLQKLAVVLSRFARGEICAARLGGEEFALLGSASALDPALALQLLQEIGNTEMPHGETITASIGVAQATVSSPADWRALYSQADLALYRAKDDGRNRVMTHDEKGKDSPPPPAVKAIAT